MPFPELGKANTRSGKGPESTACASATKPDGCRDFQCPADRDDVACAVRPFPLRGKGAQARSVRHSIRDLPQSACLPFQARGKVPDRMPAPERASAFPSSGEGPGSNACPRAYFCLSKLRGKSQFECLLQSVLLPFQARQVTTQRLRQFANRPSAASPSRFSSTQNGMLKPRKRQVTLAHSPEPLNTLPSTSCSGSTSSM